MVKSPVFRCRRSIVLCHALLAAFLAPFAVAGIRSVGKYNGVVLYDRWDNCYLFSGVYLMYISDGAKEALRPFRGRSMAINAKEVEQPVNPGDGLITKLEIIGESEENPRTPPIRGIELQATVSHTSHQTKAMIDIRNKSQSDISIDSSEFGIAVFAHDKPFFICPSDGTSCAVITRVSAATPDARNTIGRQTWGWKFQKADRLSDRFLLHSGEVRTTSVLLNLPKGAYEFIAGYGGGVHSGPCVASNPVAFDIVE